MKYFISIALFRFDLSEVVIGRKRKKKQEWKSLMKSFANVLLAALATVVLELDGFLDPVDYVLVFGIVSNKPALQKIEMITMEVV